MKNNLAIILSAVILLVGIPVFGQVNWTDPPAGTPPTNCNGSSHPGCQPPIDVSGTTQVKSGNFGAQDVTVNRHFNLLGLTGGSGAGQFLTTDSTGKVILATGGGSPTQSGWPGIDSSGCSGFTATTGKVWWNGSQFVCQQDIANTSNTGGTVTSIAVGTGLAINNAQAGGGPITTSGTIKIRSCADGEILKWSGTASSGSWGCAADNGGGGGGDNLGNHTAQADLLMGNKVVSFNSSSKIYGTGSDLNLEPLSPGKVSVIGPLSVNNNLSVGGTIKISGGSPTSGDVLTSDASGNGAWTDPLANLFSDAYYFKKSGTGTFDLDPSTSGTLRMCFLTAVDGPGTIACRLIPPSNPAPTDGAKYSPVGGGWKMYTNNANRCEAICFR